MSKIVLLVLSGKPEIAVGKLEVLYPGSIIEGLSRSEFGSAHKGLLALRRRKPDIFAVMTQSLEWQFGQHAFLVLGRLAGARETIILDAFGNLRSSSEFNPLVKGPGLLAAEVVAGRLAFRRAERRLAEVKPLIDSLEPVIKSGKLSVTYLRPTPAAGTLPGGASSHINGVVNALSALGANVTCVSNDDIAGLRTSLPLVKFSPDSSALPRAAFDVLNGLKFAEKAARYIADHPPSFIYQRHARFSLAGVEAKLASRRPLFLEYNGSEVWVGKH